MLSISIKEEPQISADVPKDPDTKKRDITKDAICLNSEGKNPYLKEISAENPKRELGAAPTVTVQGGLDATTGQERTEASFTNSIGMEFVLIPAGEFDMGSPSNEAGRQDDEGPVHRLKIAKSFYMGKYEVTQKQWREVTGNNPSNFKGDNLPVEQVSWNDVQEFIKKLNEKEGTNKYRLPSEAEWEYAARAGTTTRYSFGDDESKLGDYAWYTQNSGSRPPKFGFDDNDWDGNKWNGKTHPVGEKSPIHGGFTTCMGMSGNGWRIYIISATMARP